MKAIISIVILLLSLNLYCQDSLKVKTVDFPILIKKSDSLTISGKLFTGNSLWIDYSDNEIDQRYKIKLLETKLSSLSDITSRIDSTSNNVFTNYDYSLQQKELLLEKSNETINSLSTLSYEIQQENYNLKLDLIKSDKRTGFWKTTTLILGTIAITSSVILIAQ